MKRQDRRMFLLDFPGCATQALAQSDYLCGGLSPQWHSRPARPPAAVTVMNHAPQDVRLPPLCRTRLSASCGPRCAQAGWDVHPTSPVTLKANRVQKAMSFLTKLTQCAMRPRWAHGAGIRSRRAQAQARFSRARASASGELCRAMWPAIEALDAAVAARDGAAGVAAGGAKAGLQSASSRAGPHAGPSRAVRRDRAVAEPARRCAGDQGSQPALSLSFATLTPFMSIVTQSRLQQRLIGGAAMRKRLGAHPLRVKLYAGRWKVSYEPDGTLNAAEPDVYPQKPPWVVLRMGLANLTRLRCPQCMFALKCRQGSPDAFLARQEAREPRPSAGKPLASGGQQPPMWSEQRPS